MKKYLMIVTAVILSLIISIIVFNVNMRLLNWLFPPVVIIDGVVEGYVVPTSNLLWSFALSLVTFFVLLSITLKKSLKKGLQKRIR